MLELMSIEPGKAIDLFKAEKGLDPYLAEFKKNIDAFQQDLTTKKGREDIKKFANQKIKKSRIFIEKEAKKLNDDLKAIPKLVDKERKRSADIMNGWYDEFMQPLNDWNGIEENRVNNINARINNIRDLRNGCESLSAAEVKEKLLIVMSFNADESLEELKGYGEKVKEESICELKKVFDHKVQAEEDAKELEILRAQKAALEAEKAEMDAENVRIEEDKKRTAAIKDEYDRQVQYEDEERDKLDKARLESIERKQLTDEKLRLDQIRAKEEAKRESERLVAAAIEKTKREAEAKLAIEEEERVSREADLVHRKAINNRVLDDIMSLKIITEEAAKKLIAAMAKKHISHVEIKY